MPFDRSTDRGLLLAHLEDWRMEEILAFMRMHDLPGRSGNKEQLMKSVEAALLGGGITQAELIEYLDSIEPTNKQHVYVYSVGDGAQAGWSTPADVEARLREAGQQDLWQRREALAAPRELRLSSITMDGQTLEVYAIARKLSLRRRRDLDDPDASRGATPVVEQVYEKVYIRAWALLRWDVAAGEATLHVSQLPSKELYSAVQQSFWEELRAFFPVDVFSLIDLSKAISALHEMEETTPPGEARSQAVDYRSHGGRRGSFSSSTADQSVLGESVAMDGAIKTFRTGGIGSGGNFYFLPGSVTGAGNPLTDEVHALVVVRESRVNFPRPTAAADRAYVLGRIRALA